MMTRPDSEAGDPPAQDLQQADLSGLTISQMSRAERAELRRRYDTFVAKFGPSVAQKLPPAAKPKKWFPTLKVR